MAPTSIAVDATIAPVVDVGRGTGRTGGAPPAGTGTLSAGAHVPILHLATSLPTPTGDVAKALQLVPLIDQRNQAEQLFAFLGAPIPDMSRLNKGRTCYVALVSMPKTSLVKIVYGVCFGSRPIGATASPVDGKLLFLQGGVNNDIGTPQPVCLPATMVEKQTVVMMTKNQFSTALTPKGVGYTYPLLNRIAATTTEEIIQVAPIPPYFVYNGFDNDLYAACILERVMAVNPTEQEGMKHIKTFLRTCLT